MQKISKNIIPIIINIFLVISTIIVTFYTVSFGTVAGQVDTGVNYGWFYFATFTVDSNILLGLIALIVLISEVKNLVKKTPTPKYVPVVYLIATSLAMLTFLTVVLFLAPLRALSGHNYFDMLVGPMFFFHFFNPVLAAISYIFFIKGKIKPCTKTLAFIPLAIYGFTYFMNVVIFNRWVDFYHFTFGGRYYLVPVVFVAIFGTIYLIASLLDFLHNKVQQKS